MAYKLISHNFKTKKRTVDFLSEKPSEEMLLDDLVSAERVTDKVKFQESIWYEDLFNGVIVANRKSSNYTMQIIDLENLPEDIANQYYIYKVISTFKISGDINVVTVVDYIYSLTKTLNIYSENPLRNIEDISIVYVGDKRKEETHNLLTHFCTDFSDPRTDDLNLDPEVIEDPELKD